MQTKNARINVTFKPQIIKALTMLSKQNETSLSYTAQELVEEALEIREDMYLCKLAEEAEERSKGKPGIPAEEVWKMLDLE
jgi:predicted DNA-binding protein